MWRWRQMVVWRQLAGSTAQFGSTTLTVERFAICLLATRRPLSAQFAFSSDGAYLASGGDDTKVIIWDVVSGAEYTQCNGHNSELLTVRFSPDDLQLASCGCDGTIRLWGPKLWPTAGPAPP